MHAVWWIFFFFVIKRLGEGVYMWLGGRLMSFLVLRLAFRAANLTYKIL